MSTRRYRPLTADYPDIVKDHKFAGWVPTELQDCWYFYRHKQDEFNNNREPSDFEIVDRMVRSLEMAEVIKRVQSDKNEDVGENPIVYLARATVLRK